MFVTTSGNTTGARTGDHRLPLSLYCHQHFSAVARCVALGSDNIACFEKNCTEPAVHCYTTPTAAASSFEILTICSPMMTVWFVNISEPGTWCALANGFSKN